MSSISDEEQILELVSQWSAALSACDLDGMMRHYAEDAVLFDACPPYKTVGRDGIRGVWEKCLPFFPSKFRSEHRDLVVEVDGGCAFVYGMHHFVAEQPDHPCGQSWLRVSIGFRKTGGEWRVVHEHVSMPFNPMTGHMWPIKDPGELSMPDYPAACEGAKS